MCGTNVDRRVRERSNEKLSNVTLWQLSNVKRSAPRGWEAAWKLVERDAPLETRRRRRRRRAQTKRRCANERRRYREHHRGVTRLGGARLHLAAGTPPRVPTARSVRILRSNGEAPRTEFRGVSGSPFHPLPVIPPSAPRSTFARRPFFPRHF